jgi:radical SAM superfamily enzyme YgiQ (UPF0313 family)
MTATANRAYELGDFFKGKNSKVFIGGIHATFQPEEALKHCDKVILGEGENVIFDLLNNKFKENIIKGSAVEDLDSIPMPDYNLVQGLGKPVNISICTSRGCPHNCKFCSLKAMFGRKYRTVSTKKIIDYLSNFKNLRTLCFDESNFATDKKRAIDLLKQMKEHGISPKNAWPSVSIDVADDDSLLKMCSEISNFHFGIGLESINQKTLDSFNKKQTPEKMKKNIKKIKDYGIRIFGFFIYGSDYDDKSIFQKTVDFCQDAEIDFPSFSALTPYVGTEIRAALEKKDRIFTNDWDYYDGAHVVFHPKNMTPLELQEGVIDSFQDFYSNKKIWNHLMRREFYYGIGTFYVRHLFKRIIKENQGYLEYLKKIKKEK